MSKWTKLPFCTFGLLATPHSFPFLFSSFLSLSPHGPAQSGHIHFGLSQMSQSLLMLSLLFTKKLSLPSYLGAVTSFPFLFISFFFHSGINPEAFYILSLCSIPKLCSSLGSKFRQTQISVKQPFKIALTFLLNERREAPGTYKIQEALSQHHVSKNYCTKHSYMQAAEGAPEMQVS